MGFHVRLVMSTPIQSFRPGGKHIGCHLVDPRPKVSIVHIYVASPSVVCQAL